MGFLISPEEQQHIPESGGGPGRAWVQPGGLFEMHPRRLVATEALLVARHLPQVPRVPRCEAQRDAVLSQGPEIVGEDEKLIRAHGDVRIRMAWCEGQGAIGGCVGRRCIGWRGAGDVVQPRVSAGELGPGQCERRIERHGLFVSCHGPAEIGGSIVRPGRVPPEIRVVGRHAPGWRGGPFPPGAVTERHVELLRHLACNL